MLGTSDNKPAFLSDKQLEPALRYLLRKFPQIDSKASAVSIGFTLKSIDMLQCFMQRLTRVKMQCS
jgi:hypothetical protein